MNSGAAGLSAATWRSIASRNSGATSGRKLVPTQSSSRSPKVSQYRSLTNVRTPSGFHFTMNSVWFSTIRR